MTIARPTGRAVACAMVLAMVVGAACSDLDSPSALGPDEGPAFSGMPQEAFERVRQAQERHTAALMRIPGVVGTAVTMLPNGRPAIRVFLESNAVRGVPASLDGHPVAPLVSGPFWIIANPRTKARPAPLGFSVGHPQITAGSIGFRVRDGSGNIYILSNNHVLANSNNANINDPIRQPGPADGGTSADQIGTLAAFQTIAFNGTANTMDAAIARVASADLLGSTPAPADGGYGAPSTTMWGDASPVDGVFDNVSNLLNMQVKKYGRTTELTTGTITGVSATVDVCYAGFIRCTKLARFTDQIIVGQSGFSAGGDSGSGVVTATGNQPVGLLFAGSTSQTILNRIDHVFNRFGIVIDAGGTPPAPVTDLAVTAITTASPATTGVEQDVTVTVTNVGNQTITADFKIKFEDVTQGSETITPDVTTDLSPGQSINHTFSWMPGAPTSTNMLRGSHTLDDGSTANNSATTVVQVNAAGGGGTATTMHIGDLDGSSVSNGPNWQARVDALVLDNNNQPVAGATVSGSWSGGTSGPGSCTTGSNGRCNIAILSASMPKRTGSATFTVTDVTNGLNYNPTANTDPDGDSNGTVITVSK